MSYPIGLDEASMRGLNPIALLRFAIRAMAQPPTADEARAAATELLAMAERYKTDWNYGNAIHKANSGLGRIVLRQGDKVAARNYLLASAKSDGSPQMNSFRPNMILAKEMLEAGEKRRCLNTCSFAENSGKGNRGGWQCGKE